jgi:hypothetical protein
MNATITAKNWLPTLTLDEQGKAQRFCKKR